MKVLVTCPPMLGMIDHFKSWFDAAGIELVTPDVVQTMTTKELKEIVPHHDGWIIGDDPATREVFEAGRSGKLKAAVKWGIGVDNVDFEACSDLNIPISNTPNMFGAEVADVAVGYVIALARQTFDVDRGVRAGEWPKPCGISLAQKTVALIGFGDIGRNTAKRLIAADMKVVIYDPWVEETSDFAGAEIAEWPNRLGEADFIVITCALTSTSYHMINSATLALAKDSVRIVNVARGPVIDENALIEALLANKVHSAALDVFEVEPLPIDSPLLSHPRCVFGSHNSSNTVEAVQRTSELAIHKLFSYLGVS